MQIRKMIIEDYEAVYQLWLNTPEMGMNTTDDSKDGIEKYLRRNPETCFVVVKNEEIIGVILSGHDGRRAFIYHAAVKISERGQGIGYLLVETAIEALRLEGISKAALVAFVGNKDGNSFWEKAGFTTREDISYRNREIIKLTYL
jgi:ribosomal protein S18 acetylase RimI-like enzyme